MTDVEIRPPKDACELEAGYALRWEVLRAPWQKPHGSERDELDDSARHYLAIDTQGNILATGRIHSVKASTAQIRYVAVHPDYEKQGLGKQLLAALECNAASNGENHIILHARDNSLAFYLHCGYRVIRQSYLLFDVIQHYEMEKFLQVNTHQ
ncbi:putative GNAT family N-acyltransferase [Thiogranum longum]|uniref:Putative GNAT family N-acyltransferase n=1 Tax=Thiogranum longum TaxID=1537524 RepID=A0A4V2PGX3_9GAMM|nr:GNAT family N-acetyltransferase [Thiogranum longum]TCK18496.1 putative GNAT family N-acyltransferase [Thiogranum longum]